MAKQSLNDNPFDGAFDNSLLVKSLQTHVNKLTIDIALRHITNEHNLKKTEDYIVGFFKGIGYFLVLYNHDSTKTNMCF